MSHRGGKKQNVFPKPKEAGHLKTTVQKQPAKQTKTKTVKIVSVIPENVQLQYSDNILVQSREGMFMLSFMQLQHPVVLTDEEVLSIESIESKCISRFIITPIQLARNMKALEENFTKFLEANGSEAKDYKEFLEIVESLNKESEKGGL